jgi:hypothetical protein
MEPPIQRGAFALRRAKRLSQERVHVIEACWEIGRFHTLAGLQQEFNRRSKVA